MDEQLGDLIREVAVGRGTPDEFAKAAWKLFDLVAAETDPGRAVRLAEDGAEEIGRARGIKPNSVHKYRQRGRDMLRYREELSALPRVENPLSIVARLRNPRPTTNPEPDLDLALINAILNANTATQNAVVELVESGRLQKDWSGG